MQESSRTAEAVPADSLRGLRAVVTVPLEGWFYGPARQYGALYADVLRQVGAAVLGIPIEPLSSGRMGDAQEVLRAARRFRPDVAIGLHDAGYARLCGMPGRAPAAGNLFADGLGVPTVLLWDHALLQFAPILLGPLPDHPDGSRRLPAALSQGLSRLRFADVRARLLIDDPRLAHPRPSKADLLIAEHLAG